MGSACARKCYVIFSVSHSLCFCPTGCWYRSEFTAASRGFPATAWLSCFTYLNTAVSVTRVTFTTFFSVYMFTVFTARCTLVQSAVLWSHVVCLSVRLSVTLVNCDHIGWNSSKIISPLVSLGCSLFASPTWRVCSKGNTPKLGPKVTHPLLIWASETFNRKLRPNGYR